MLVSLDITYTLFHIDGKPLRAKLAVKLKEYRPVKVQLRETENTSPDVEKRYVVRTGETLSSISAAVYRDPSKWRELAIANGITDPTRLSPGVVLTVPASRGGAPMTATATRKEGLPESYYAPEFAIEIEGEELDPASKGDVLELKIEMTFNEMTSAEVKLNNFDDTAYDLKWSDADKLRLGSRVHVKLGYADRTRSMMRGYISTLTPEFARRTTDAHRPRARRHGAAEVVEAARGGGHLQEGHRLADRAEDRPTPQPAREGDAGRAGPRPRRAAQHR